MHTTFSNIPLTDKASNTQTIKQQLTQTAYTPNLILLQKMVLTSESCKSFLSEKKLIFKWIFEHDFRGIINNCIQSL